MKLCSLDSCNEKHHAKGLCRRHYFRQYRNGDVNENLPLQNPERHGLKYTRTYTLWVNMRVRCNNPNDKNYPYYGGRGIKVDPTWSSFTQFLADMGNPPTDKHTLDRINANGPYTKSNCRWATRKEQARNRGYCKLTKQLADEIRTKYASQKYRQIDLAKEFNVSQRTISLITRNEAWT